MTLEQQPHSKVVKKGAVSPARVNSMRIHNRAAIHPIAPNPLKRHLGKSKKGVALPRQLLTTEVDLDEHHEDSVALSGASDNDENLVQSSNPPRGYGKSFVYCFLLCSSYDFSH